VTRLRNWLTRFGSTRPDATRKPTTRETAGVSPDRYTAAAWRITPYRNPDELTWKWGRGLAVYQEMTRDPYVKAGLRQRKHKLLAGDWRIEPASTEARDLDIARFCEWALRHFLAKGTFKQDLYEMLDAMDVGFSVMEIVWEVIDSGNYRGLVGVRELKSKNPFWIEFRMDEFGNLLADGLTLRQATTGAADVRLPTDKFIIWSYLARYENPYGTSDLRAAYRAYWIKDTALKLRAVFLERFSGNNLILRYPRHEASIKDELKGILDSWQSETGLVVPEEVSVETIKVASSPSASEFSSAVSDLNREILVGVLGETLTVDPAQFGTRALGEVQDKAKTEDVLFMTELIQAVVNQQLIRRLVDYNFAPVQRYPAWVLNRPDEMDPSREIAVDQALVRMGVPLARRYFYERYGRPQPKDDEELIRPPGEIDDPFAETNPGQTSSGPG
jgi:phage gp29-like protein